MAIWQYRFTVIPNQSISSNRFDPPITNDGLLEDDIFWLENPTTKSFFQDFEKVLPRGKSWTDDLLLFGDVDSNCFEIYSEDETVISVSFRVDFSRDFEAFLRGILELVSLKGLCLLDEDHNVIDPNYESIKQLIKDSRQYSKYHELSSG